MKLNDKVYDTLKWIVMPALSALYWGLSGIWGWLYAEQVVGTVAVVTTFLGALLGISTAQYKRDCQSCEDESV